MSLLLLLFLVILDANGVDASGTQRGPSLFPSPGNCNPQLRDKSVSLCVFADGAVYQGQTNHQDLPHGLGLYRHSDEGGGGGGGVRISYRGEWRDGMRHGQGVLRSSDGYVYSGEWRNDQRHGQGVEEMSGVGRYEGAFAHDTHTGRGTFYPWA